MRALLVAATLLTIAVPTLAREPVRRSPAPMATPSIMVEEPDARAERKARPGRRATSRDSRRPDTRRQSTRLRPRVLVRSTVPPRSEDQFRAINRSIDVQQQQVRDQQQSQFEANQIRQQLHRGTTGSGGIGSSICLRGQIGC